MGNDVKLKVYLETSFVSYLTGGATPNAKIAADQAYTRLWWERERTEVDVFVSGYTLAECEDGNATRATERLDAIRDVPVLPDRSDEVVSLARKLIDGHALPEGDAPGRAGRSTTIATFQILRMLITSDKICQELNKRQPVRCIVMLNLIQHLADITFHTVCDIGKTLKRVQGDSRNKSLYKPYEFALLTEGLGRKKEKMIKQENRKARVQKRHRSLRNKLAGTAEFPRLAVYRSTKHIYAQLIDDDNHVTLASASSNDKDLRESLKNGGNIDAAKVVGEAIAKKAKKAGVECVVFDRGGFLYHGRVAALADAAREAGLMF